MFQGDRWQNINMACDGKLLTATGLEVSNGEKFTSSQQHGRHLSSFMLQQHNYHQMEDAKYCIWTIRTKRLDFISQFCFPKHVSSSYHDVPTVQMVLRDNTF
jgi:hypothetical protein